MTDLEAAAHVASAAGNILDQLHSVEQRLRAAEIENRGLLAQIVQLMDDRKFLRASLVVAKEREKFLRETNTGLQERLEKECAETDRLQLTCSTLLDGCGVDDVAGKLMGEAGKRMKILNEALDMECAETARLRVELADAIRESTELRHECANKTLEILRLKGALPPVPSSPGGFATGQPIVRQIAETVWRVDLTEVHGTIFNGPDAESHARRFAAGIKWGQSR